MYSLKIILLISNLIFLQNFEFAQNYHTIDSLNKEINKTNTDTLKSRLYILLGNKYKNLNIDTAIIFYSKSLDIISQNNNKSLPYKKILAECFYNLGIAFKHKGMNHQAINYLLNSLMIYKKLKDQLRMADCYEDLANVYVKCREYKKGMEYLDLALEIDKKNKNPEGIASNYLTMGIISEQQGQYNDAMMYYKKSIDIKNKNNKTGLSNCYNNIGNLYLQKGLYSNAMVYYQKALKEDELNGSQRLIASDYGSIANVHYKNNNLKTAENYYVKSYNIYKKINNQAGLMEVYTNLGNLYADQGLREKAIDFYKKAMAIAKENSFKRGVSVSLTNIGLLYQESEDFKNALDYYKQSLIIKNKINDQDGLTFVYNNIAAIFLKQHNYKLATAYSDSSLNISKKIENLEEQLYSYKILSEAHEKAEDTKLALQYFKKFQLINDSMFNVEKNKQFTEMESKYQSEKKQHEIDKLSKEKALQNSEMKKQRMITLFVVCGLLFVVIVSVILFRLFLLKKKANKIISEKNGALQSAYQEINIQKEEIIVQRDNLQEQKEIIEEHQREIEDSINYAKRIQQAVMPNIKEIKNTKYQLPNTKLQAPLELGTFILFRPKDIVSGDFYWSTQIGEMLILTVADCTGHGVPGAFMSMLGISFLNEIVRKKEITKANEVLDILRDSIIDALQQKGHFGEQQDGMDIVFCAINMQTLEMQFAGANNPCWIVKSEKAEGKSETLDNLCLLPYAFYLEELKGDKQPIGIYENMKPFTNHIYQLHKGDSIYLMSDGYEDQFGGPNRKKFLAKNLKNLLTANSQQPMANQQQILETTLNEWMGSEEQIDDITVLGIKV